MAGLAVWIFAKPEYFGRGNAEDEPVAASEIAQRSVGDLENPS